MRRLLAVGLCLAVGVSAVQAAPVPVTLHKALTGFVPAASGNGYVRASTLATQAQGQRLWNAATGGSAGGVTATDAVVVAAKGGPLAVSAKYSVSADAVVGAIVGCLGAGPVVCAAGAAIAAAYIGNEWRISRGPQPGTIAVDPGNPTVTEPLWVIGGTDIKQSSPTAAAIAYVASMEAYWRKNPSYPACDYSGWQLLNTADQDAKVIDFGGSFKPEAQCGGYAQTVVRYNPSAQTCPGSVDPFDPSGSIAKGAAPMIDGKCRTARYNHQVMPVGQVPSALTGQGPQADLVGRHTAADPTGVANAVGKVVDEGGQSVPATVEVTGPASQTGTPTTTTTTTKAPDGSSVTTRDTVTNVYNYSYAGDTITYTVTNITSTTNNAGDEVKRVEEQKPVPVPGSDPLPPEDPCSKDPERVGCLRLGTAPTESVPKSSNPLAFAPETVIPGAACPADVPLPNGEWLDYQPTCDAMVAARPFVLGLAAIAAAMICVAGLRAT